MCDDTEFQCLPSIYNTHTYKKTMQLKFYYRDMEVARNCVWSICAGRPGETDELHPGENQEGSPHIENRQIGWETDML